MQNGFQHREIRLIKGWRSGTSIVIAIHSLGEAGVALGGCRMLPYGAADGALTDAKRLSAAMTLKCAALALPYGGAKCVIAAPPSGWTRGQRRRTLLDAGDAVEALHGQVVTGKDAGTTLRDINVLAEQTRHIVGLSRARGGSGDPSSITALGVQSAIEACLDWRDGSRSMAGKKIAILGLGKVGSDLAHRCARRGARLVVSDIAPAKRTIAKELGAVWRSPDALLETSCDVLAPCALGGLITQPVARRLRCRIVAGAANNQLAEDGVVEILAQRDILWAPDFIVNAGGLIGVVSELDGYDSTEARRRTKAIARTTAEIFARAETQGETTLAAAIELAKARMRTEAVAG